MGVDVDHDEDNDDFTYDADGDCNDYDPFVFPGTAEIPYDGVDQNCNGSDDEDADGDGQTVNEGDCNDQDATIFLGAIEFFDGVDNDCNNITDEANELSRFTSLLGPAANGFSGSSHAGGDLDGDGLSDLAIGIPQTDTFKGEARLVLGRREWPDEVLLASVEGGVVGENTNDRTGSGLALCDFDGNGLKDLAVGAMGYDGVGIPARGEVGLYLRKSAVTSGVSFGTADAKLVGPGDYANLGASLACGGYVNDDAYEDLLVGVPGFEGSRGAALLVIPPLPNGAISYDDSLFLQGTDVNDRFGWSVSGGGDVNGDGYDDLLVGAPGYSSQALSAGAASLFLGGSTLSDNPQAVYFGERAFDQAGQSVALLPDVNGDGFDDILISAPWFDGLNEISGRVYLIFGNPAPETQSLEEADVIIDGASDREQLGLHVASLGDINQDGLGDFGFSSLYEMDGQIRGGVAVFLGREGIPAWLNSSLADALFLANGEGALTLEGGGDVNGPNYPDSPAYEDFVIGMPSYGNETGISYLLLGQATGE